MKPKLGIDDYQLEAVSNFLGERGKIAVQAGEKLADSVRPIWFLPLSSNKPIQTGSCVLVRLLDEYFVFSASHVFEDLGEYPPLIPCGDKLVPMPGERFSRKRGPSGTHQDDPIDASVYHLDKRVPDELKDSFLTFESLDVNEAADASLTYLAVGFRANRSKSFKGECKSQRDVFASVEFSDSMYSRAKINRNTHLALAYEKQVYVGGKWQLSPSPKGMSGGGLFGVSGVSVNPLLPLADSGEAKLSAIIIEQRKERHGEDGAIVGCRIGFHLGLIDRYLPGIIEQLDSENAP